MGVGSATEAKSGRCGPVKHSSVGGSGDGIHSLNVSEQQGSQGIPDPLGSRFIGESAACVGPTRANV